MDNRDEIYPSVRNDEKTDKILETPVRTVDSRPWKTVMSLRDGNKVNLMTLSWLTCEISGLWGKVWETRWQVVDTLNSGRSAENLGRLSKAAGGNRVVETWELQRERTWRFSGPLWVFSWVLSVCEETSWAGEEPYQRIRGNSTWVFQESWEECLFPQTGVENRKIHRLLGRVHRRLFPPVSSGLSMGLRQATKSCTWGIRPKSSQII